MKIDLVSSHVIAMVVEHTPSPVDITEERVEALMCDHSVKFDSLHENTQALKASKWCNDVS